MLKTKQYTYAAVSRERKQYFVPSSTSYTDGWWKEGVGTSYSIPSAIDSATITWGPRDPTIRGFVATLKERSEAIDRTAELVYNSSLGDSNNYCQHTAVSHLNSGIISQEEGSVEVWLEKTSSTTVAVRRAPTGTIMQYDGLTCPLHSSSVPDDPSDWEDGMDRAYEARLRLIPGGEFRRGANYLTAFVELRDLPSLVVPTVKGLIKIGRCIRADLNKIARDTARTTKRGRAYYRNNGSHVTGLDALLAVREVNPRSTLAGLKKFCQAGGSASLYVQFGLEPTFRDLERIWLPLYKQWNQAGDPIERIKKPGAGVKLRASYSLDSGASRVGPYTQTLTNTFVRSEPTTYWNGSSWVSFSAAPVGACTARLSPLWQDSATNMPTWWRWAARAVNDWEIEGLAYGTLSDESTLTKDQLASIRHTWRWGRIVSTSWEVMPYSWLIDWCFNVGDVISKLENYLLSARYSTGFEDGIWYSQRLVNTRYASAGQMIIDQAYRSGGYLRFDATHKRLLTWHPVLQNALYQRDRMSAPLQFPRVDCEVTPFRLGIITALLLSHLR